VSTVNINTDAMVVMTARLEKLGNKALPNAVRATLNAMAFDVKKRTLPKSGDEAFENRSKNFFKAFSRVEMAKGNDINSMRSIVGMGRQGVKSPQAIEDMEQQEKGGTIRGRAFIPLDTARTGKSKNRMVTPKNRLGRIGRIIDSANAKGKNKQEQFMKSAIYAGVGGVVIGNFEEKILFRITGIKKVKGKIEIRKTPIYSYSKGRAVKVSATHFSEKAAMQTVKSVPNLWIKEGERELKKYLSK